MTIRFGIAASVWILSVLSGDAVAEEMPVIGDREWICLGENKTLLHGSFSARVDTGARTTSIDATDFDLDHLEVGKEFSFSFINKRVRTNSGPVEWQIAKKTPMRAKLERIKPVNGSDRPFVKVWLRWRNAAPKLVMVNLNSRNKEHRVLLGRNWIAGKYVDIRKTLGKPLVIDGEKFSDIRQGALGSCSILAAFASASRSGVRFSDRITYHNDNIYRASYFGSSAGHVRHALVDISDGRTPLDPQAASSESSDWWPLVLQRAYLHSMESTDRSFKNGSNAVAFVSGNDVRRVLTAKVDADSLQSILMQHIQKDGYCMIAQTKTRRRSMPKFSRILLSHHAYAVIDADEKWVSLFNPHGVDIRAGSSAVDDGAFREGVTDNNGDDPLDGVIRLDWEVFHANFKAAYMSTVKPLD